MSTNLTNPKAIAERGEAIYRQKYQAEFETKYPNKYLAIDIGTERAYLGNTPEEAVISARKDAPGGLFHLIKIGALGAFRVSYTSNAHLDWIFQ